ncbi:MAG: hypothetical protein PHS93_09640, partial [Candidatus Omnitrophica bacterium]|nr:hypothetical protein [Candidatus Omnitrophota bacterium]
GIFSSTKNTSNFKPGEKVEYTSTPPKEGAHYPKFRIKKLDEKGEVKEYKNRYNDMASVRSQCYGLCGEIAIRACVELGVPVKSLEYIDTVSKYFYDWAIKDVKERDMMYCRIKALSNIVDSIKFPELELKIAKPWGAILEKAEHYLSKSLSVKESDKVPTV